MWCGAGAGAEASGAGGGGGGGGIGAGIGRTSGRVSQPPGTSSPATAVSPAAIGNPTAANPIAASPIHRVRMSPHRHPAPVRSAKFYTVRDEKATQGVSLCQATVPVDEDKSHHGQRVCRGNHAIDAHCPWFCRGNTSDRLTGTHPNLSRNWCPDAEPPACRLRRDLLVRARHGDDPRARHRTPRLSWGRLPLSLWCG